MTEAPIRNLTIYLGAAPAAKKPQRRLAVVDGNFRAPDIEAMEHRFAYIRVNGRICYLRRDDAF